MLGWCWHLVLVRKHLVHAMDVLPVALVKLVHLLFQIRNHLENYLLLVILLPHEVLHTVHAVLALDVSRAALVLVSHIFANQLVKLGVTALDVSLSCACLYLNLDLGQRLILWFSHPLIDVLSAAVDFR